MVSDLFEGEPRKEWGFFFSTIEDEREIGSLERGHTRRNSGIRDKLPIVWGRVLSIRKKFSFKDDGRVAGGHLNPGRAEGGNSGPSEKSGIVFSKERPVPPSNR